MSFPITRGSIEDFYSQYPLVWDHRRDLARPQPYYNRDARGRESEVQNTDKEFRIRLDLHHFKPDEVKITSENRRIVVEARHEEQQDNQCSHSEVTREVKRVYRLPADVDLNSVTSSMTPRGLLNIRATKLVTELPKDTPIPIEMKRSS